MPRDEGRKGQGIKSKEAAFKGPPGSRKATPVHVWVKPREGGSHVGIRERTFVEEGTATAVSLRPD